jgi:hypothetical protein
MQQCASVSEKRALLGRMIIAGLAIFFCQVAHATMYLQEAFNYTAGTYLGNNAPWQNGGIASSNITVATGNLSYLNLAGFSPAGNLVNAAQLTGTTNSYRAFDSMASSGLVYWSFLLNSTTAPGSSGYYIAGLLPNGTTTPGGRTADPIVLMAKSTTGFLVGRRQRQCRFGFVRFQFCAHRRHDQSGRPQV